MGRFRDNGSTRRRSILSVERSLQRRSVFGQIPAPGELFRPQASPFGRIPASMAAGFRMSVLVAAESQNGMFFVP